MARPSNWWCPLFQEPKPGFISISHSLPISQRPERTAVHRDRLGGVLGALSLQRLWGAGGGGAALPPRGARSPPSRGALPAQAGGFVPLVGEGVFVKVFFLGKVFLQGFCLLVFWEGVGGFRVEFWSVASGAGSVVLFLGWLLNSLGSIFSMFFPQLLKAMGSIVPDRQVCFSFLKEAYSLPRSRMYDFPAHAQQKTCQARETR